MDDEEVQLDYFVLDGKELYRVGRVAQMKAWVAATKARQPTPSGVEHLGTVLQLQDLTDDLLVSLEGFERLELELQESLERKRLAKLRRQKGRGTHYRGKGRR